MVSHAFSHGFHPEHTQRLAAYWAESLGGPTTYSDCYGDETSVVRIHSGNGPHQEMDRRAIACFDQALVDIGLPSDDRVRQVVHDYQEASILLFQLVRCAFVEWAKRDLNHCECRSDIPRCESLTLSPPSPWRTFADLLDPPKNPYVRDPVGWVTSTLGEFWWSGQHRMAQSVIENRYSACNASHDVSKSHTMSRLALWWMVGWLISHLISYDSATKSTERSPRCPSTWHGET